MKRIKKEWAGPKTLGPLRAWVVQLGPFRDSMWELFSSKRQASAFANPGEPIVEVEIRVLTRAGKGKGKR